MSDNVRVYEIAEEIGASSNDVITKAKEIGFFLKSPQSAVSFEDAEEIANFIMTGKSHLLDNHHGINPNDITELNISIENLKQIKKLDFSFNLDKSIIAIIGNNGVGKSSLITCLGKLVEPTCLREEFMGNDSYKNSKVVYTIDNELSITWEKPKNWTVSSNNSTLMPKFNGVFEASLITGHRFNHIEHKKKKIHDNQLKKSIKVDDFIIKNLDFILNGEQTNKYNQMYKVSNNKVSELHFIKYEKDYITEFYFSAGEYFLLSILKFINKFKDRKNKDKLGLIIIDEIEISLHPLAQKRLIEKLTEFKDEFNLLIIFATHSLQIIDTISPNNIYYFENKQGNCKLINPIYQGYLTSRLYNHTFYDKIILVEDILAKKFIDTLLKEEPANRLLYEIIPIGGWEKVLEIYKMNQSQEFYSKADVIAILDGDVKTQVNKLRYSNIDKRFLPIENVEKYTVLELFNDEFFRSKTESRFLGHKTIDELPIIISTNTTEQIKQSYNKGIIEEIAKHANVYPEKIEDYVIEEVINKLKKEHEDKITTFKAHICDFLC